jgi:hypothetical protein
MGSIFGGTPGQPTPQQEQAAAGDLQAASNVMEAPMGATPEESQTDAGGEATPEEELGSVVDEMPEAQRDSGPTISLEDLMGDEEEESDSKPFGDQGISEDEAVEMTRR